MPTYSVTLRLTYTTEITLPCEAQSPEKAREALQDLDGWGDEDHAAAASAARTEPCLEDVSVLEVEALDEMEAEG